SPKSSVRAWRKSGSGAAAGSADSGGAGTSSIVSAWVPLVLDKIGTGTTGSSSERVRGGDGATISGSAGGLSGSTVGEMLAALSGSPTVAPAITVPTAAPAAAAEIPALPVASARASAAGSTAAPARAQLSRLLPSAVAVFAAAGRADLLAPALGRGESVSRNGSVITSEPTMSSTRAGGKLQKAEATNCRTGRKGTAGESHAASPPSTR